MPEIEQAIIVTGDLRTDSDALERHLQEVIPERFRTTSIVDTEGLKKSIAEATTIKLAVVNVNVPRWQEVIKKLSENGTKVYALSHLSSVQKCLEAYNNGASGYGHSLEEIFRVIDLAETKR